MAKRRGRPPKRKPPKFHLGQASSLPGPLWAEWLSHIKKHAPTWLWVATFLCHAFCCRITEVLRLRAQDISIKDKIVHVASLKRAEAVDKRLLGALLPKIVSLKDKGVRRKRQRKAGARGLVRYTDAWVWPEKKSGYLFPSDRQDARESHRTKDTACKAVSRLRQTFSPRCKDQPITKKIRTHSARHRMVNDLKAANIPDDVAMRMARIKDHRTYSKYGQLSDQQVGKVLDDSAKLRKTLQDIYGLTGPNKRQRSK